MHISSMISSVLRSRTFREFLLHAIILGIFVGYFVGQLISPFRHHSFIIPLIFFSIAIIALAIFATSSKWRMSLTYWTLFFVGLFLALYIILAAFYPGYYSGDSVTQLDHALKKHYLDVQPPLMAWMWSVLISITGHFELLLFVHLGLLAIAAICWAHVFKRISSELVMLIIPLVILSPVIVNFAGSILSDIEFAYALLLASGIASLAFLNQNIRPYQILIVALMLTCALGVRWNGVFSVVPIAAVTTWYFLVTFNPNLSTKILRMASIGIAVFFVAITILGLQGFYYGILKTEKCYIFQVTQLHDIAGISISSGKDYFPDFIKKQPEHDMSKISAAYRPSNIPLFFDPPFLIPCTTDPQLRSEVTKSWLIAIYKEPFAYYKHRAFVDSQLIKGTWVYQMPLKKGCGYDALSTVLPSDFQKRMIPARVFLGSEISRILIKKIQKGSRKKLVCSGWFWLTLLFIELIVGCITYKKLVSGKILLLLSSSSLLCALPLFITAPSPEFRYFYWSNIAASFAAIAFFADGMTTLCRKFGCGFPNVEAIGNGTPPKDVCY